MSSYIDHFSGLIQSIIRPNWVRGVRASRTHVYLVSMYSHSVLEIKLSLTDRHSRALLLSRDSCYVYWLDQSFATNYW